MQVPVGGDGHKIRLYALFTLDHTDFSHSKSVAVEGMDLGAQHHRAGFPAVNARRHAVQRLEGTGERLVAGKAVVHGDVQQRAVAVPHLLQGEGQPPPAQIVPQRHARDLPELPGGVVRGVPHVPGQPLQRQRLLLVGQDGPVDLVHHALYQSGPFVHARFLPS